MLEQLQRGFRYADDLKWFDTSDLKFVEAIERGTRATVFVYEYVPNGRHLFLDEKGRTYRFSPSQNPSKPEGSFSIHSWLPNGILDLRPELRRRERSFLGHTSSYGWEPETYDPWDDNEPYLRLLEDSLEPARSTPCYGPLVRREITQRELRNQSGEIMRALDRGDEFVVTRNGEAVGELLPLRRKRFVATDALLEQFRGAPDVDYAQLRSDLDAVADPDPTPRA
jgi:antitoxin (DNA-binding transcriptional repressor) of toxin-antitoxin stability system